MILDKMEAFKALERFDIRVARTAYVDSAEAAVAFAERRDARDPREMPIVLRPAAQPLMRAGFGAERPLKTEEAIRLAYERVVASLGSGARVLAQEVTERGTDVMITGETKEVSEKTIALHGGDHVVQRMVPVDGAGAAALAGNFQAYHHRPSSEHAQRMLEHLLQKISTFFEQTPVTEFQLAVRLHENGYTVLDASMISPKPLHLVARLDPRAHDRKGDDFRPAGRQ